LIVLSVIGVILGLFSRYQSVQRLAILASATALIYLLLLSNSATKLWWYILPSLPWIAMLAAIPLGILYDWLYEKFPLNHYLKQNIIPVLVVFYILSIPYLSVYHRIASRVEKDHWLNRDFYAMSYYLRNGIQGKGMPVNGLKVLNDGYYAHLLCYQNMARNKGITFSFSKVEAISSGDEVLVSHDSLIGVIRKEYTTKTLDSLYTAKRIKLLAKK